MQKIISLFKRDYDARPALVYNEVVPGAEWVLAGEGVATDKIDGTSVLIKDGKMYKRFEVKTGKIPPEGWIQLQDAPDPVTGHWPGWLAVSETNPEDKWHLEGFKYRMDLNDGETVEDGTYELIGPKVGNKGGGNPYNLTYHKLWKHGVMTPMVQYDPPPRNFDGIKKWFETHVIEGIVWHHPDGRMVKIKRRDFGLDWPEKAK